ncbi:hypothetical protein ICE98_00958 [Lactococcus lactis]|nr:hypothetical protein [Lactococcus lactis]
MGDIFISPAYQIKRVPIEKIRANAYNPNRTAPPEFQLLERSILEDGYTMPIVCYYDKEKDFYEIVDGFHRYLVMKRSEELLNGKAIVYLFRLLIVHLKIELLVLFVTIELEDNIQLS